MHLLCTYGDAGEVHLMHFKKLNCNATKVHQMHFADVVFFASRMQN